jgi:hypothetical protein
MNQQNKQPTTHTLAWEDQRSAMLAACNGKPISPGNAPILGANQPIICPICEKPIVLRWKVHVAELSEADYMRYQEKIGVI